MSRLKNTARRLLPRALWESLASVKRAVRRLTGYPETARIGKTDYDDYWDAKASTGMGQLSAFRRRRAEVFARVIRPGARVLDLGVGDGAILRYLIERRQIDGYGLDVSPKAVEFCRAQGLNVDLADINQPIEQAIDGHFDAVIMSEIIEHIPEPETLLNSLRPHAMALIVSIPNTGYYQHRLRLLLGKFPLQWVVTPGEHLRFWTIADFRWWARQMGFRIAHQEAYQGTPGLRRLWPSLFGQAMVYVLEDDAAR